jgi:hypothetical protein
MRLQFGPLRMLVPELYQQHCDSDCERAKNEARGGEQDESGSYLG